jgi:class 3 adenylate cyclase
MSGVKRLLEELQDKTRAELETPVKIEDYNEFPDVDNLRLEGRQWVRLKDVVAVVVDLKNSTRLDFQQRAGTSARLYEAVVGGCARIAHRFSPGFVDIQGDGLFALYHGENAFQRALCAGVTLKTFGQRTVEPATREKMGDTFPKTGLKVGMHSGTIVVKKVGLRGTNEPVWAGRPVNWATKCGSKAEAGELIATRSVYGKFEHNQYVTHSCGRDGHGNPSAVNHLWNDVTVEALPDPTVPCKVLKVPWCEVHGDAFCEAILAGKTRRPEVVSGTK